jgi:TolA-binding protein
MKDIRTLLLVLLSVGLVATWGYHIYDKTNYSRVAQAAVTDSIAVANTIRDSLQKTYAGTITQLDVQLDSSRNTSDSLVNQLNLKVYEINKLKSDISSILKNPRSTSSQLAIANKKMVELEEKVQQLRDANGDMEAEKLRLNTRLDQLSGDVGKLEQNIRRLDDENKSLNEKIKLASVFVASAVHFAAIDVRGDSKEQETGQAKKADKLVASFVLQNNLNEYPNAEVIVVIEEPDGHVLQSSIWDSGMFDTRDGRKSFTRRIKFDYEKGEQKQVIFSLDVSSFQKGNYKLQIWHNGFRIGEMNKTLG